jgi:hypothetical protein
MSSSAPFQSHIEDVLMDIFFSLPVPAGTSNIPKNVINKKLAISSYFPMGNLYLVAFTE